MPLPSKRTLKPRNAQIRGKAIARTQSVPAPIGGLNAVDSLAAMPPENAIVLDNFFPQPTYVQLRNGSASWSTGLPGVVETIMPYNDKAGNESIFSISGTAVYNSTANAAVGAAVVTALTNARWEWVNVGTAAGAFLYAANGVDKPLFWDGTTWVKVDGGTTPAITGVTTTDLFCPQVWKNRVWFIQKNTSKAWYLPVQSIGGAAAAIDFSTQFRLGGYLATIVTFSVSSATSFDDYIGFLSSEGELAVYQGTDPSSASDFAIVGIYRMGKPIGRRCWFKYGADAVVICSDGLVSVSRIISVGIQQPKDAVSYKIQQLISDDILAYSANYGWQGVVHPFGNKILINVPVTTNTRYHQLVMSSLNSNWCTFGLLNSPWNAACFCVSGDRLFWGGNTIVYKGDTGRSDAGAQIFGSALPAFSYFGTNRQKRATMARPILITDAVVTPALGLNIDFAVAVPTGTPTFVSAAGALWGTGVWGSSLWGGGLTIQRNWQTIYGVGFSFALYIQIATTVSNVQWLSTDFVLTDGGVL